MVVGLEGGLLGAPGEASKAVENLTYAMHHYTTQSLFSTCSGAMQVDGAFGMAAAVAEMVLQSHEDELALLPAVPESWHQGGVQGLCGRGGFEIGFRWKEGRVESATVLSKKGNPCRIRSAVRLEVTSAGKPVEAVRPEPGLLEFKTVAGETYLLEAER